MQVLSNQEIQFVAGGATGEEMPTVRIVGERWNQDTKDYYDAQQDGGLSGLIDMAFLGVFGDVDFGQIYGNP